MLFDFVGKIKNVDDEHFEQEFIAQCLSEIHKKFDNPMNEIRVLKDDNINNVLVKAQASVSSYLSFHEEELSKTVEIFREYLEEIAKVLGGEVSKDEGFYNNNKTFRKLFS